MVARRGGGCGLRPGAGCHGAHRPSCRACLPLCPIPHHCRYELHSEFEEALDHAQDRGKNTKVLLKVSDVGVTYE